MIGMASISRRSSVDNKQSLRPSIALIDFSVKCVSTPRIVLSYKSDFI